MVNKPAVFVNGANSDVNPIRLARLKRLLKDKDYVSGAVNSIALIMSRAIVEGANIDDFFLNPRNNKKQK